MLRLLNGVAYLPTATGILINARPRAAHSLAIRCTTPQDGHAALALGYPAEGQRSEGQTLRPCSATGLLLRRQAPSSPV
jgi:hypothetical protein